MDRWWSWADAASCLGSEERLPGKVVFHRCDADFQLSMTVLPDWVEPVDLPLHHNQGKQKECPQRLRERKNLTHPVCWGRTNTMTHRRGWSCFWSETTVGNCILLNAMTDLLARFEMMVVRLDKPATGKQTALTKQTWSRVPHNSSCLKI